MLQSRSCGALLFARPVLWPATLVPLLAIATSACPRERPEAPNGAPSTALAVTPASSTANAAAPVPPSATPPAAPPSDAAVGPTFDPTGAVWSPDKSIVATLIELRVHLWDGATKAHLRELDVAMCEEILFAPNGKTLYIGRVNDPPLAIRDATGQASLHPFDLPQGIPGEGDRGAGMLSVSADGAWLLGRCNTVEICLWNTKTYAGRMWRQPATVRNDDASLTTLAFAAGDKRIRAKNEGGATYELEAPSLRRVR